MFNKEVYDYAIVGAGAAGLHLAMAMVADPWFANKSVLLLDKDEKNKNDRTWSFWEKGNGQWDHLLEQSWAKGQFFSDTVALDFDLAPYRYKTLEAIRFYEHAKRVLLDDERITWQLAAVRKVETGTPCQIFTDHKTYQAGHVFDSRIDRSFEVANDRSFRILQHFKGWVIETPEPAFDVSTFVMMDFRLRHRNSSSFTYVLPFSDRRAMVEFTLFTEQLLDKSAYDGYLKTYLREYLNISDYRIEKTEYGVIPMSDFPFEKDNHPHLTKIGTAGAYVKASSGYGFKNIERMAAGMVRNLQANRPPARGLISRKFRLFDSLYLDVLTHHNEFGATLYSDMFRNNSVQQIFKFLDEETTLAEDFAIMNSLERGPFLKAVWHRLTGGRVA